MVMKKVKILGKINQQERDKRYEGRLLIWTGIASVPAMKADLASGLALSSN